MRQTRWDVVARLTGLAIVLNQLIDLFGPHPTRLALVVGILCGPVIFIFAVWGVSRAVYKLYCSTPQPEGTSKS